MVLTSVEGDPADGEGRDLPPAAPSLWALPVVAVPSEAPDPPEPLDVTLEPLEPLVPCRIGSATAADEVAMTTASTSGPVRSRPARARTLPGQRSPA